MKVIKANGIAQEFDETKIQGHAAWACEGLDVSQSELETNIGLMFYDGMKTSEIADGLILAAAQLISEKNPDYTYVAARLTLQKIFKDVTGSQRTYPRLTDYLRTGVEEGRLNPELLDRRFDLNRLNDAIEPERDFQFDYLGIQTLQDRYLLRCALETGEAAGRIFELPQHLFMRVAMGLSLNEDDPTSAAIRFYNVLSKFEFMCSTPTLFNAGTNWPQLSSCYGTFVPDDLEGIFDLGFKEAGMLSKFAGGIGSSFTSLRGSGSPIFSTNGKSSGPVPFLKIYNDVAVAVNQGGKRKGAFAPYLEVWHKDIFDFIDLKMKTGDERLRTHDIFPAIWACDLFFERVRENGDWTLFCPNDVPHLHEMYGEQFRQAYLDAEKAGLGRKTVKALELWQTWLDRLHRTGAPWVTFKDECNRRNPQQHTGIIHNSNLCTEITLNNSNEETFVCNLGSVNLSKMTSPAKLRETIHTAVQMLDNVIDINYYPTENSRRSNLRHRPIGLGVMGYAEWLIKNGIDWESEEHIEAADALFEQINFFSIEASVYLARKRGAYPSYEGSTWSRGQLTIDHAKDQTTRTFNEGEWDYLRRLVKRWGVRNSNITSIAPTATIANICGTTECIQSINERVLVKENLSGSFKVINPLAKHNRPELVKTMWEMDMTWVIRAAAARQKWLCQSQSLNLFKRAGIRGREMSEWYLLANELGVKTTYYLKVQKEKSDTAKVGEGFEAQREPAPETPTEEFVCEACQ